MALDPKRPAPPNSVKMPPPPASRRPISSSGTPSTREPASERGPGFVWLLAPHPGRIRASAINGTGGMLGRGEDASLRVDAPGVSPSHAKVELSVRPSGGFEIYVTDSGTTSGTYVSGMRASRTVLADGDLLRVGSAIALVVEREVGSYEGSVLEEGGIVRGPRSRRGWFGAVERAIAEPREGRRAAVIAGPRGSGRKLVARRIGEAWGIALYAEGTEDGASEVDLSSLGDEEVEPSVATAAGRGSVVLRGVDRAPESRRFALARALEKRRTVPVIAIVDELTWPIPPELDAVLGGHRIDLPSIENRREEIPSLVRARFEKQGVQGNRLSIELYEALTRAAWPDEIEEIIACVDLIASSHAAEPRLGPEHLVRPLSRRGGRLQPKPTAESAQTEADRIRQALADAKGSVAAAARTLHLSRQALYREAARLGIDIRKARESEA